MECSVSVSTEHGRKIKQTSNLSTSSATSWPTTEMTSLHQVMQGGKIYNCQLTMKISNRKVPIAVTITAHVSSWHWCLLKAEIARLVRGWPTPRSQQEGKVEPEKDPLQEEQPETTKGRVIADYNLDVDNEGSAPEVELMLKSKERMIPKEHIQW